MRAPVPAALVSSGRLTDHEEPVVDNLTCAGNTVWLESVSGHRYSRLSRSRPRRDLSKKRA
jgi:hypothetical protein